MGTTKRSGFETNAENTPPSQSSTQQSKRARLKTSALSDTTSNVYATPKNRPGQTRSRAWTLSQRHATPRQLQRLTVGGRRLTTGDFLGIPNNPLRTLLIAEHRVQSTTQQQHDPLSLSRASSFLSRRRSTRSGLHSRLFSDLNLPCMKLRQFERERKETVKLNELDGRLIFRHWKFLFNMKHNVLVYGSGMKETLLQKFAQSLKQENCAALMVDGSKRVSAAEVIRQVGDIYGIETHTKQSLAQFLERLGHGVMRRNKPEDVLDAVKRDKRHLYLIVHAIDGAAFKKKPQQEHLAMLAGCRNISIVASLEHVTSGLLWDTDAAHTFRWSSYAVHTLQDNVHETNDRKLLLNPVKGGEDKGGDDVQKSLMVLRSFVSNAQQIFGLMASQKIQPMPIATPLKDNTGVNTGRRQSCSLPKPSGLSLDALLKKCKERFLVSNISVLKNHLDEFITHGLVERYTASDGDDVYKATAKKEDLETILKELKA